MRHLSLLWLVIITHFFTLTVYAEENKSAVATFSMDTTAFLDKSLLPVLYTCDGKDKSPELTWKNVPAKTQSFALIMNDLDVSPNFYHWILYNIPKSVDKLSEGITALPAGILVGKNSWGNTHYNGPCPPKGSTHSYVFTLYALDSKLKLPAAAEAKDVLAAIKNHTIGKTDLTAVYSRWME